MSVLTSDIISSKTSPLPSITGITDYTRTPGRAELFSGIEINQNQPPLEGVDFVETNKGYAYQTFQLPSNYKRESKYAPEISGFQACVTVTEPGENHLPTFSYLLQYENLTTSGWVTVASGVTEGIHAYGNQIWADIYFSQNVEITPEIEPSLFRIGLKTTNVDAWWFSRPRPYKLGHGINLAGEELPEEGSFMFRLLTYSADQGTDWIGNSYRHVVFNNSASNINTFLSKNIDAYWLSKPNPSKFAIENLYLDITDSDGNAQVIDRILINPITLGPTFHVYYSNDGEAVTTPEEWDQKLWTPVSQEYRLTKRESFVLPTPITAKFVCIEFSRLQAQYYAPGTYQQPVIYKKFPDWITNYFSNAAPKLTMDPFIANKVRVVYNKLKLGFNYYLKDLNPGPIVPEITASEAIELESGIDPSVLAQINTNLAPYTAPLNQNVTGNSVLANFVRASLRRYELPVEELKVITAANTETVSVPEREQIVEEEQSPDMYFFITSRHFYQLAQAEFEFNRAYFVGIKELALLREDYNILRDNPLYIETAGDNQNTLLNDFFSVNGNWQVFDVETP